MVCKGCLYNRTNLEEEPSLKINIRLQLKFINKKTYFLQCRKQKQAKHVITFFSRVAHRCFEMSNFNSSMAILTGLSLGPVTRLKKVWDKFEVSELEKLQVMHKVET